MLILLQKPSELACLSDKAESEVAWTLLMLLLLILLPLMLLSLVLRHVSNWGALLVALVLLPLLLLMLVPALSTV